MRNSGPSPHDVVDVLATPWPCLRGGLGSGVRCDLHRPPSAPSTSDRTAADPLAERVECVGPAWASRGDRCRRCANRAHVVDVRETRLPRRPFAEARALGSARRTATILSLGPARSRPSGLRAPFDIGPRPRSPAVAPRIRPRCPRPLSACTAPCRYTESDVDIARLADASPSPPRLPSHQRPSPSPWWTPSDPPLANKASTSPSSSPSPCSSAPAFGAPRRLPTPSAGHRPPHVDDFRPGDLGVRPRCRRRWRDLASGDGPPSHRSAEGSSRPTAPSDPTVPASDRSSRSTSEAAAVAQPPRGLDTVASGRPVRRRIGPGAPIRSFTFRRHLGVVSGLAGRRFHVDRSSSRRPRALARRDADRRTRRPRPRRWRWLPPRLPTGRPGRQGDPTVRPRSRRVLAPANGIVSASSASRPRRHGTAPLRSAWVWTSDHSLTAGMERGRRVDVEPPPPRASRLFRHLVRASVPAPSDVRLPSSRPPTVDLARVGEPFTGSSCRRPGPGSGATTGRRLTGRFDLTSSWSTVVSFRPPRPPGSSADPGLGHAPSALGLLLDRARTTSKSLAAARGRR